VPWFGQKIGSDGLQFFLILFSRRTSLTPHGEIYLKLIKRAGASGSIADAKSAAAARILFLLLRPNRHSNDLARHEYDSELIRLLEGNSLSRWEQILTLDILVGSALMSRDPAMVVNLENWLQQMQSLAPNIETVSETRGAVLVELGQYQAAKDLLEPLAWTQHDPHEQIMLLLFLGYAEFKLGNLGEAYHCLWTTRRLVDQHKASEVFVKRLTEIESEIAASASEPLRINEIVEVP
jgi:tetratricopeptide (TPR) repeat protein